MTLEWIIALRGLPTKLYPSHSMRAGGATHLYLSKVPLCAIQRFGRWISPCFMVYLHCCNIALRHLGKMYRKGHVVLDQQLATKNWPESNGRSEHCGSPLSKKLGQSNSDVGGIESEHARFPVGVTAGINQLQAYLVLSIGCKIWSRLRRPRLKGRNGLTLRPIPRTPMPMPEMEITQCLTPLSGQVRKTRRRNGTVGQR